MMPLRVITHRAVGARHDAFPATRAKRLMHLHHAGIGVFVIALGWTGQALRHAGRSQCWQVSVRKSGAPVEASPARPLCCGIGRGRAGAPACRPPRSSCSRSTAPDRSSRPACPRFTPSGRGFEKAAERVKATPLPPLVRGARKSNPLSNGQYQSPSARCERIAFSGGRHRLLYPPDKGGRGVAFPAERRRLLYPLKNEIFSTTPYAPPPQVDFQQPKPSGYHFVRCHQYTSSPPET